MSSRFLSGLAVALAALVPALVVVAVARAEPVPYSPPAEVVSEPSMPEGLASCPSAPGPYEGEDPVVAELRAGRLEAAEACVAETERQRLLLSRVYWLAAEDVAATAQRKAAGESLDALVAAVCSSPCPVKVEGGELSGSAESSESVVASIDAGAEASKLALWVLCGEVIALVIAFAIWRTGALRG